MTKDEQLAETGDSLKKYWEREYPDCPPIGYMLRQTFADRWFRIHTLPASKRYPDNPSEKTEILNRHNSLLSSIMGKGADYVLVTTGYSNYPKPVRSYPQIESIVGKTQHWLTLPLHELEGDSDPNYWHFFFVEGTWNMNSADELLGLVCEGIVANVLFVSFTPKAVYHPYDGGADIFIESEALTTSVKTKYASWLSTHPAGL